MSEALENVINALVRRLFTDDDDVLSKAPKADPDDRPPFKIARRRERAQEWSYVERVVAAVTDEDDRLDS